jgi:SAM-dependent methyltransferase
MKLRFPFRAYTYLDRLFLRYDKRMVRRTRNLRLMPDIRARRMPGRPSYAEWCYVVGVFQTVLSMRLRKETDNRILDVGSGSGIMAIACEPFVGDAGHYTGIDVKRGEVDFCRSHYPREKFSFVHLDAGNPIFVPEQMGRARWDIADESMDVVTALSVWTHMNEDDAVFYIREVDRVLRPGGQAFITFYVLDDLYRRSVSGFTDKLGKYNNSYQDSRIFNVPSSASGNWIHPDWATHPEDTIGVTPAGLETMMAGTRMSLAETLVGNWKEVPGVFYQDVLVFEKR